jgi:hypothetical protein
MQDQLFIGIRAELKAVVPHKEVVPRVLGVLDGGRQGRGGEGGKRGEWAGKV